MANNYVIDAKLRVRLDSASTKPVIDQFQRQLASKGINIPVNLQFKHMNVKDIANQNAAFRTLTNTIKNLGTVASKSSLSLQHLNSTVGQIRSGVQSFGVNTSNLNRFNQQINTVSNSVKNVGTHFRRSRYEAISFAESVGISARRFLSFGLAAAVLAKTSYDIRNATVAALEFDREMIRLKQVGDDSNQTITSIARTISKLGIHLGVSSKEMSTTAVMLRQAGLSARETQKALEILGKTTLSPTFEDLKSTTEGLIALFNQFDKNIFRLENHFSAISKVSADFAVESSDLVEALKRTGGAFREAGGSVNELLAMFTTIRQTTRESAESIATGMRTILARLQDPVIAHKLDAIGVKVYDLKGKFVGPYEAVERLGKALRNLPQGDIRASQILKDIGGLRQLSRVIPLIYNQDVTHAALQSAEDSIGKLDKDARMAQEALLIQINRIKEGFLDLFRVITTDSSVKAVLSGIATSIEMISASIRTLKPLLPILLGLATVKAISTTVGAFSSFRKGFTQPATGYASGGSVTAYMAGGGLTEAFKKMFRPKGTDVIPAMLSKGEYVVKSDSARRVGYNVLDVLNQRPDVFKRVSAIGARNDRRKLRYGMPSLYTESGETQGSFFEHITNAQLQHAKKMGKLRGDYRFYTSPEYFKNRTIEHKKYLRDLINEHVPRVSKSKRLDDESLSAIFGGNSGYSAGGTVTYFAHGGVVGKDLTIDILKDYLKRAGINIDVDKYVKGVNFNPNLNSRGSFVGTRNINIGPKGNIGTLLHELGHAIDYAGKGQFSSENRNDPHHAISNQYQRISGVDLTSLYGNGGLMGYKDEQRPSEGFANAFATWALSKGLTKKELKSNFPHLSNQMPYDDVKSLIQSVEKQFGGTKKSTTVPILSGSSPPSKPPTVPPIAQAAFGPEDPNNPFSDKRKVKRFPIGGETILPRTTGTTGYTLASGATIQKGPIPIGGANINLRKKNAAGYGFSNVKPINTDLPYLNGGKTDIANVKGLFAKPRKGVNIPTDLPDYTTPVGDAANFMGLYNSGASVTGRQRKSPINNIPVIKKVNWNQTPPKDIYDYVKTEQRSQANKNSRMMSAKNNIDRIKGIEKQFGIVEFDIKNLDKIGNSKLFPSIKTWSKNISKGISDTKSNFDRIVAGVSKNDWHSMSGMEKQQRTEGRMFKLQMGLMGAGTLVPMASQAIFGNARTPGFGGETGSRIGSALGGGLSGAAMGASFGATFGGIGAVVGAFGGAIVGTIGSLKQFDEELKQIHMEQFGDLMGRVNFNTKSANFQSEADAATFSKAIERLLPDAEESRTIHGKNLGYFGRISEEYNQTGIGANLFGTIFGGNTTVGANQGEIMSSLGENEKRTISDAALGLFKQIAAANPNATEAEILKKGNAGFQNRHGISMLDALGLSGDNARSAATFFTGLKKAAAMQEHLNAIMAESNKEFAVSVSELEKFSEALQINSEQYSKRLHYTEMGVAPLQGNIMAAPNDINLGALGGPNTLPGRLHEFSAVGGGFDQAKQKLIELLQTEGLKTIAHLNPEESELQDTRVSTQIAQKFKESGAGGSYNKEIGNHLQAMLENTQNIVDKINNNPSALADQLLEKYKPIKTTGENAKKQLQETYGLEQQRQVNILNRRFALSQQIAEHNRSVGEFFGGRRAEQELENPNMTYNENLRGLSIAPSTRAERRRAAGILNKFRQGKKISIQDYGFAQRKQLIPITEGGFVSPEERALAASTAEHKMAFQNARNQFAGANLSATGLENAYRTSETELDRLKIARNKAGAGPSLQEVQGINTQINALDEAEKKRDFIAFKTGNTSPEYKAKRQQLTQQLDTMYKSSSADNIRKLDQEILATQSNMRDYNEQLKLLASNTTALEDAQKKYQMAQEKATADYEVRKKDADVLAFGSQPEKMDLMMRENITQQALSLGQDQFSNLPDLIKKIVFERLNETQGLNRQIQKYDRYGRENGVMNVTGEQAINYFRQPYLNTLMNSNPRLLLERERSNAAVQLDETANAKFKAQNVQLDLNKTNIDKQAVQGSDNYQKFLQGINQSIKDQMDATNKFLSQSAELTKALNNFNGTLTIERNGRIEVILNGGQILQNAKGDMEKEILETVINQLRDVVRKEIKNQPAR